MGFRSVVKKLIPSRLFQSIEPFGHLVEAVAENVVFGFPMRKFKVIAVTGTAGKTTTCTLIAHTLRQAGHKVGMVSTVSIDYGDGRGAQPNPTRMTSLGSLLLIKTARRMKRNGVEWLVLEMSSQALSQHRTWSVPFEVVGYTNLSHDNYHYHRTFKRYREAKLMLFKQANRNRRGMRVGVVNADDENGHYFTEAIKHPLMYGIDKGNLRATQIKLTPSGSTFVAKVDRDSYKISTHLPGRFNVYNCLAAIGICRAVGLSVSQIEKGIASLDMVTGRMNNIDEGQDFGVIVDYAPNPDAFEKVFAAIKPTVKDRMICVFGTPGRRDELKAPIQGELAGRNCDIVILTEEDDRDQDGQRLMELCAAGAEKAGKKRGKDLLMIHKREDAVEKAIGLAKKDDMVLLLGKGEETVIITNKPGFVPSDNHPYNEATDTIRRPYNETETARAALKKLAKS